MYVLEWPEIAASKAQGQNNLEYQLEVRFP